MTTGPGSPAGSLSPSCHSHPQTWERGSGLSTKRDVDLLYCHIHSEWPPAFPYSMRSFSVAFSSEKPRLEWGHQGLEVGRAETVRNPK